MDNKRNKPFVLIDTGQVSLFKQREKKYIAMPECILEEYSLDSGNRMSEDNQCTPLKQYDKAEGYEFTWGHILERRTDKYVVWDFCLTQLLTQYLRAGKRLSDLQRAMFYSLERSVDCTARDIIPVLSMQEGWKILPCSAVGAFTLVMHFTQEAEAREWISYHFLSEILPVLISDLQKDATQARR